MEILKLNNQIADTKYSIDRANNRMEKTGERISEFENKTIEISQCE